MNNQVKNSFPEWMTWEEMAGCFHSYYRDSYAVFRDHMNGDLTGILNRLQSEEDWRVVRSCLRTIEFAGAIPFDQSETMLAFLVELLFHESGSVRRLAAVDIGHILTGGLEESRDQCADLFRRILFLSGKKSEQKRRWIGSALEAILAVL